MQKNNKRNLIQQGVIGGLSIIAVSSIALTLHFNSLNEDLEQSNQKLNAKYEVVLVENEELRSNNDFLVQSNTTLEVAAEKSSKLLEQSQTEIEKLKEETDTLQGRIKAFQSKVAELEKKQ